VTAPPTDGSSYRFLSDVIMARELVEPSAMKAALQASLAGRSLTELLVDNGHLGEDDLARTLAEHHRLDHVDLEVFSVDHDAASLIAPDVARRFGAVPIAALPSGAIVVALHDPNGSTAALEFARLTGRVIQPAVASRSQIEALIESLRRGHASAEDMTLGPVADVVAAVSPGGKQARLPGAAAAPSPFRHEPATGEDSHVEAMRRRAEAAERRYHEAEDRARAAEELTRLAEARARASEERALAAGGRVVVAEIRDDEQASAAGAAHGMLERVVHACEMLELEAQSRGPAADVLRTLLEAERAQRMQLEAQVRHPPDVLLTLHTRVAELERIIAAEAARVAEEPPVAGAPPAEAAEHAPEPRAAEVEAEPGAEAEPEPAPEAEAEAEPEELAAEEAELVVAPEAKSVAAALGAEDGDQPDAGGSAAPSADAGTPPVSVSVAPAASSVTAPRRGRFGSRKRGI
jgi:hypothetical protein